MNIALGYILYNAALGHHLHRAFTALNHTVTYVGLTNTSRAGYGESTSILEIVKSLDTPPHLFLWIDPAGRYFPRDIEKLDIPTACYLVDVHLGHWREQAAKFFDVVFVAQKDYVDKFKQVVGHNQVYWLPLGAANDVHFNHRVERIYDVGFVGNISVAHQKTKRVQQLKVISGKFKTNNFNQAYSPSEVGRVYSQSKIVFNSSIAGDVTMRIFEGAASGSLVLTDQTANGLGDLFAINTELVTFADTDDLLEKIEYFLNHTYEREVIAASGQARVISEHTYQHRVQRICDLLAIPSIIQVAPMRRAPIQEVTKSRYKIYTHLHMLDAIFDDTRIQGYSPIKKFIAVLPCLARRILVK